MMKFAAMNLIKIICFYSWMPHLRVYMGQRYTGWSSRHILLQCPGWRQTCWGPVVGCRCRSPEYSLCNAGSGSGTETEGWEALQSVAGHSGPKTWGTVPWELHWCSIYKKYQRNRKLNSGESLEGLAIMWKNFFLWITINSGSHFQTLPEKII